MPRSLLDQFVDPAGAYDDSDDNALDARVNETGEVSFQLQPRL